MSESISLNQLEKELDFFHKMYDSVRLVDPIHKKVLDYRGTSIHYTDEICFNYWGNGVICENCISIRAYKENKSFVKLEKANDDFYMVTAIPIENTSTPVVLELFKDATNSMFIGFGDYNTSEPLQNFIQKVNDLVVKDSSTNLYNRRFVDERLPVDLVTATLNKQPLSLCYFDLDNFKMINDTHGHEIGDSVIKEVSNVITKNIRNNIDWACRLGGDEFMLCLKNTTEKQSKKVMERIRTEIERIPDSLGITSSIFSISYGIATTSEASLTADELIKLADEQMYKQKKGKFFK